VLTSPRPLLLITGIAEGLGAGIATAFAGAGYDILGLARSNKVADSIGSLVAARGGRYTHLCGDVTQGPDVAAALESHIGRISVVVHNAGALLIKPFDEIDAAEFEAVWRVTCLGAMIVARLVLPHMIAAGTGAIILTGATAGAETPGSPRSRRQNLRCADWHNLWRANTGRRASTLRTWFSMA
jgi:3-oxoacyl-[acyl-carrier protein] reductase